MESTGLTQEEIETIQKNLSYSTLWIPNGLTLDLQYP